MIWFNNSLLLVRSWEISRQLKYVLPISILILALEMQTNCIKLSTCPRFPAFQLFLIKPNACWEIQSINSKYRGFLNTRDDNSVITKYFKFKFQYDMKYLHRWQIPKINMVSSYSSIFSVTKMWNQNKTVLRQILALLQKVSMHKALENNRNHLSTLAHYDCWQNNSARTFVIKITEMQICYRDIFFVWFKLASCAKNDMISHVCSITFLSLHMKTKWPHCLNNYVCI